MKNLLVATSILAASALTCSAVPCPAQAAEAGRSEPGNPATQTPQTEPKAEDPLHDIFMEALDDVFPLDPEQIRTLRNRQNQTEEAITRTPAAKIRSESRPLPLEPGQVPLPVVLTPGYVGAVAFFDSTGAPWPVSRAVIGNDALFNLVTSSKASSTETNTEPAGDAHVLYVTPLREHANSNILIHLEGAPVPVVIPLVSDPSTSKNRQHQGVVNFMARSRGPKAKPPVFAGVAPTISDAMMSFLDGVPPEGAKSVALQPGVEGVQLWEKDNKYYLRGVHQLIWPAYKSYAENNGVRIYEMPRAPSLMLSVNGVSTSVKVEK